MDIGTINSALNSAQGARQLQNPESAALRKAEQATTEPSLAKVPEPTREKVESAVNRIQEAMDTVKRNVNFSLEDDSGRIVVKVTDASSGEVIRQMPSEEALRLAENLEQVRNLMFSAEA